MTSNFAFKFCSGSHVCQDSIHSQDSISNVFCYNYNPPVKLLIFIYLINGITIIIIIFDWYCIINKLLFILSLYGRHFSGNVAFLKVLYRIFKWQNDSSV